MRYVCILCDTEFGDGGKPKKNLCPGCWDIFLLEQKLNYLREAQTNRMLCARLKKVEKE